MDINADILRIIYNELGKNSADLFYDFYGDFPLSEQVQGASDLLRLVVGPSRTKDLLKAFIRNGVAT